MAEKSSQARMTQRPCCPRTICSSRRPHLSKFSIAATIATAFLTALSGPTNRIISETSSTTLQPQRLHRAQPPTHPQNSSPTTARIDTATSVRCLKSATLSGRVPRPVHEHVGNLALRLQCRARRFTVPSGSRRRSRWLSRCPRPPPTRRSCRPRRPRCGLLSFPLPVVGRKNRHSRISSRDSAGSVAQVQAHDAVALIETARATQKPGRTQRAPAR